MDAPTRGATSRAYPNGPDFESGRANSGGHSKRLPRQSATSRRSVSRPEAWAGAAQGAPSEGAAAQTGQTAEGRRLHADAKRRADLGSGELDVPLGDGRSARHRSVAILRRTRHGAGEIVVRGPWPRLDDSRLGQEDQGATRRKTGRRLSSATRLHWGLSIVLTNPLYRIAQKFASDGFWNFRK